MASEPREETAQQVPDLERPAEELTPEAAAEAEGGLLPALDTSLSSSQTLLRQQPLLAPNLKGAVGPCD